MIQTFPRAFSNKAIKYYIAILAVVSILALKHAMAWYFMAIGLASVYGFFHYASVLPEKWKYYNDLQFEKKLFKTAFVIRLVYVLFAYVFYWIVTKTHFDFECGDVLFYHSTGETGADLIRHGAFSDFFNVLSSYDSYGDMGYVTYLSVLYTFIGDSILLARAVKAVFGAAMCVLVYKLASRNFDVPTGRLAGILFMLLPNAIYYCGSHLKEIEMVFLVLLFTERADNLLRARKYSISQVLGVLFLALLVFFFRTALAVVLVLSLGIATLMTSNKIVGRTKKFTVIGVTTVASLVLLGTGLSTDISYEWDRRNEQSENYQWRSEREGGNSLAKYASKAVFAPMIFTIPFPTMVNIQGQEHTQMLHGGNYVKNILSIFTILALLTLLMTGKWRDNVLILSVMLGYLFVLAVSQFAQSERFHFPALPFEIMLVSYGITHMNFKFAKYIKPWFILMLVAGIGWNLFKLKGRGLL